MPVGSGDTAGTSSQTSGYSRPTAKARFRHYLKDTFGPEAAAKNIASAGFSTWTNKPREWGPTWSGFGKRFASNTGKTIIGNSAAYGLDEAMRLDSSFYRSSRRDVRSRLLNGLLSPVTARNSDGKRVLGVPRIVGVYTANIIAVKTWYPKRYGVTDGLVSGTISLGTSALFGVVREFIKL